MDLPWIIVTAGGTREPIDAVRFIGNRSTGRTGVGLAREASSRGMRVVLLAAVDVEVPDSELVWVRRFETGGDLEREFQRLSDQDPSPTAIFHAAAVGDFAPEPVGGKIPSGAREMELRLRPTRKIVASLRDWFPKTLIVQFKLEVGVTPEGLQEAAFRGLATNRTDIVVANDLEDIGDKTHEFHVFDARGPIGQCHTKADLASMLLDLTVAKGAQS